MVMKPFLIFTVLLMMIPLSFAQKRDCFRQHLLEAIKLNKDAMVSYGKLSMGASDRIFRRLIRAERIGLIFALYLDRKAQIYVENGIPLFCEEFIPIELSLGQLTKFIPPEEDFQIVTWSYIKKKLETAIDEGNFEKIRDAASEGIRIFEKQPHFYCMLRHVFESIYRISHFAPLRIEASKEIGLPSPKKIILKLIRLHVRSLKASNQIDEWSAPLQSQGIPILCRELPRIMEFD
jgi:hypothetical protein